MSEDTRRRQEQIVRDDREWGLRLGPSTTWSAQDCIETISLVRNRIGNDAAADEYFEWLRYRHDDMGQVCCLDISLTLLVDMGAIRSGAYKRKRRRSAAARGPVGRGSPHE